MTLGQRIQELRKAKNLSQEQLGAQLGVSRQAVSRWEMDGAVPEVDKLIAMSRLFGVDLNDLLQVEHRPSSSPQKNTPLSGAKRKFRPSTLAAGGLCAALLLSNLLLWGQVVQLKRQFSSLGLDQLNDLTQTTPQKFDPLLLDLDYDLAVEPGDPAHLELQVSFSLPDSFHMEDIAVHLDFQSGPRSGMDTGFVPMERDSTGTYHGVLSLQCPADKSLDGKVTVYFSGQTIQGKNIGLYELVYYPNTNNSKVFLTYLP